MDLVVDANILFSAVIKSSKTAELLFRDDLHIYAPEYLFEEFKKYREELLERTHRTRNNFERFSWILKKRIEIIPKEEFKNRLAEAKRVSPDPGDVPYFALAIELDAEIWSNDDALKSQNKVAVWKTHELVEHLKK